MCFDLFIPSCSVVTVDLLMSNISLCMHFMNSKEQSDLPETLEIQLEFLHTLPCFVSTPSNLKINSQD